MYRRVQILLEEVTPCRCRSHAHQYLVIPIDPRSGNLRCHGRENPTFLGMGSLQIASDLSSPSPHITRNLRTGCMLRERQVQHEDAAGTRAIPLASAFEIQLHSPTQLKSIVAMLFAHSARACLDALLQISPCRLSPTYSLHIRYKSFDYDTHPAMIPSRRSARHKLPELGRCYRSLVP